MRVYLIYNLINFTAVSCKTMIIRYRNDKNLLSESLTSNNTNKTPFSESMILICTTEISKGEAIQPFLPLDSSFCGYVIIITFMLKNRLDRDQYSKICDL